MPSEIALIDLDDVLAAQEVINGGVHHTPIIASSYLGELIGVQLHLKLELFQKTGSFKPRGVLNKLHHLSPEERERGVITISAGNHGQALAWAATQSGIDSVVVMPASAVAGKVQATRDYGGEVVLVDGDMMETLRAIQSERGLILVHPFDDPMVIAGQGTVGLEILEDLPEVEAIIAGVGGGGLVSGIATAAKAREPSIKVIGVEPQGASAMKQSLAAGEPIHLDRVDTVADGLAAPFAGEHTLPHVQARVDEIVIVSDDEIIQAARLILERCKVVAEPAAASTLAALLSGKVKLSSGTHTVCVLSGGNVDWERLKSWM